MDFVSSLPCERMRYLLPGLDRLGTHIRLTREEEGVGISAGAALAGRRPAMFVQSSGVGNMINALLSLTKYYGLPLAVFVSHRGLAGEQIKAQVPMGKALIGILRASGIDYVRLKAGVEFKGLSSLLREVYTRRRILFFLIPPSVWGSDGSDPGRGSRRSIPGIPPSHSNRMPRRRYRRYQFISAMKDYLRGRVVVCNLGIPSKELYHLLHQPSNFYMLGSMGMAIPIGLGIALNTQREVVVIEGDGSLLMNPSTLAHLASLRPRNMRVLLIDNGVYGSTGDQPTHASTVVNISALARSYGIKKVFVVSEPEEALRVLRRNKKGPIFLHLVALAGNENLPPIPLQASEIRDSVMRVLAT